MGEVYRARDPRLNRDIALKLLPEAMAVDPERRERFEREAQTVAALNHPNIVTIHSIEQARLWPARGVSLRDAEREAGGGGVPASAKKDVYFLTMELVQGKTLSEIMSRPGLPVEQVLKLAIPLADAISAAHQRGITHRDLKPTNIMVTEDGRLKVLDFRLAKLKDDPLAADLTALPTKQLTGDGRILGTVAYISPEQAEGRSIDHRSDIFSLGIVLYELATGERPFKGDSSMSVLSSILKDTPRSVTELNQTLPRELGRIIRHCLAKDPARRYQTAVDLRNEVEELKQDLDSGELAPNFAPRAVNRHRGWLLAAGIAAALVVLAAIGGYVVLAPERVDQVPAARVEATFTRLTTQPGVEQSPSLSPDGSWLVYSSGEPGSEDIYLQSVGGQTPITLTKDSPGSDTEPAFSPDGERIVFRSDRQGGGIFVMGRTGESPRRLSNEGFNPAWASDGGEILYAAEDVIANPFARAGNSQLWALKVATGEKRLVSEDAVQPSWSPHGRRIAYWTVQGGGGERNIYTIPAVGRGEPVAVTSDPPLDWNPVWSSDGTYLHFSSNRGGSLNLWRVPIDEESGKPLGQPETHHHVVAIRRPSELFGRRPPTCLCVDQYNIKYPEGCVRSFDGDCQGRACRGDTWLQALEQSDCVTGW
jgi:serine/threonine protein kinase